MIDYRRERNLFISETANVNILARVGSAAYARYRLFLLDALEAIGGQFDEATLKWLPVARLAANGELSNQELAGYRSAVEEYRRDALNLTHFDSDLHDPAGALTVLLLFALEDWPAKPEAEPPGNIGQSIDEFTSWYIQHFGSLPNRVECLG